MKKPKYFYDEKGNLYDLRGRLLGSGAVCYQRGGKYYKVGNLSDFIK